jgi:hypothetical protein
MIDLILRISEEEAGDLYLPIVRIDEVEVYRGHSYHATAEEALERGLGAVDRIRDDERAAVDRIRDLDENKGKTLAAWEKLRQEHPAIEVEARPLEDKS